MTTNRKQLLYAVLLIVAVTAVAYAPSLQNGFTNWDDNQMVTDNPMIRSISPANIIRIFSSMHYGHYHPLVVLSYALEFNFFHIEPWIYHFTNLFIHILNSLLVFWFIRSLRGGLGIPLAAALLFATHPLHVESVAWVTERKDLLYSFFYFLALIAYVKYVRTNRKTFLFYAGLAFLCSLLSKAMAVTLPVVLLLIDFLLRRKIDRNSLVEKFPFLALSFLFGVLVLYATYPVKSQIAGASFGFDNILIAFHGLLFYGGKFLFPLDLSSLYPYPGRPGDPLPLTYTIAPYIVFGILALLALSFKKRRVPFFCAALYVVTVSPVLQLTRVGGVIAADRFVYFPVLGLILGVLEGGAWLVRKNPEWAAVLTRVGVAALAAVILVLSILTWQRTQVWRDSLSLWNDVARQYPGVAILYNNRGFAYADRREFKKALEDYSQGLALAGDDWRLLFNSANALRELGAHQEALAQYDRAVVQYPTNADIYYYRGLTHHSLGRMQQAIDDYSQALKLNPRRVEAFVNRGSVYAEMKDYERALADFNSALTLDPDGADVYFNRGALLRILGRPDEALIDFTQALELEPRNVKTLNFRGMTFFGKGEFDRAIEDYGRALDIEPSNPGLYNNRGAAFYQKRAFQKAIADYSVALSLSPNTVDALTNRAFAYFASQKPGLARIDMAALRKLNVWIDPRLIELAAQK